MGVSLRRFESFPLRLEGRRTTTHCAMVWKIPLPGALLLEAEELPPKERRCEDSCCSGALASGLLSPRPSCGLITPLRTLLPQVRARYPLYEPGDNTPILPVGLPLFFKLFT